ncbi:Uncharacterised protein [Serratia quinivorans]|uniref:Uncharacterized protein n=1 Tax=Serratia quinivorans TaxID=137545 RepID=A0A380D7A0_9GAMM|nr:Uncharacterised protein [Serratia quinivorans]SUJ86260.1 Uncharacterised protein [Serratia quinivorans]
MVVMTGNGSAGPMARADIFDYIEVFTTVPGATVISVA